jgi:NADP-dependent 3-hydroxy acid dehydrogenase YdfG
MSVRTAIVTGASSGIGRAIVERLVAKGYNVVANARGAAGLAELEEACCTQPGTVVSVPGDASSNETISLLLNTCLDRFKSAPSIGVVNAGRGLPGSFTGSNPALWAEMIELNVLGVFRQMRMLAAAMMTDAAGVRVLSEAHDIVVIGSAIGTNVSPINPVYGATKFAVHGATEALRRDLSPSGIRVTLIQPGVVKTNFQEAAGYDENAFARYAEEIGPLIEADDIARTVEFVLEQPSHVHLNDIMIRPTRQPYP